MEKQHNNVCVDGDCPQGIELLRKIGLTPEEKRAIFLTLKHEMEIQRMAQETLREVEIQAV